MKDGTTSDAFDLPLEDLDKINWPALDPRFLTDLDCSKPEKYLAHLIRFMLPSANLEREYCINRLGVHIIEDVPLYCAGDKLICPSSDKKVDVALEPLPQRLIIDTERYPEHLAVSGMIGLTRLCTAGVVIFAHSISGITRAAFIDAGITPCAVLQVVTRTGMHKTTYVSQLTQMYNRDGAIKPPVRLNATPAHIENLLNENCDCVVILDDIHPAEARDIVRKNESTLEEITRRIGDSTGRGHMEGGKQVALSPKCNVIVTGEYIYGKGSTAARTLVVGFTQPIDSENFHRYQGEPLMVSTFNYYFIAWYISHYYEICELLKQWLADFRKVNLGVHPRLQETFFCFDSAYKLFLTYCVKQSFTSYEQAKSQQQHLHNILLELIRSQQERVEVGEYREFDNTDYLKLIRMLFESEEFHLPKTLKRFDKNKHDGVIHYDCLCLRGEKLLGKIRAFIPDATINEIRAVLFKQEALKTVKNNQTIQVAGLGGLRFYAIPLGKLD